MRLPFLPVERALHLLPDIDALGPLRFFLVSAPRGNRGVAVEALEPERGLEAAACFEYAQFRRGLGELDECRAYLYRAQGLLESGRDSEVKAGIRTELAGLGTH